ncbi:MAG: RtcB family protein [Myxococcales bacterium]|nr:RtcB family protein [Myxococcales bacterium]
MLTIKGTHNTARVFIHSIDDSAATQIRELCNQPFVAGSTIRIMPDTHAGAGCPIGTTMTIRDAVVPNLVGVDIGCGMETVRLHNTDIALPKLDALIHTAIPAGFRIRKTPHRYARDILIDQLRCKNSVDLSRARHSIGTLGGGNHFIELNRDGDGHLYLVVHSGSRHLGHQVASHYQNKAYESLVKKRRTKATRKNQVIKVNQNERALAPLEGSARDDYLHDMRIAQDFARHNRNAIVDDILDALALEPAERFTTVHNYIDLDTMILRKGAISAKRGEKVLIPLNMRDGSIIAIGKGNKDWNESAPHGAGRLMSRTEARRKLRMDQYKSSMAGIYSTTVSKATLDECALAYKPTQMIVDAIRDTVDIQTIAKPIYNFKAAD